MHRLRFPVLLIVILLPALLLASVALALDTPQTLIRHVHGSGGQQVAAGSFVLDGTLGEPIVGPSVAAGEYKLSSGYWREITHNTRLFLPLVRR
jgi:hypothetical protein